MPSREKEATFHSSSASEHETEVVSPLRFEVLTSELKLSRMAELSSYDSDGMAAL